MIYPIITDRVAVVTGGAKGIGACIARRFSDAGYSVVIGCRSSVTEADRLARELVSTGRRAIAVRADLSSESGAKRLRDETVSAFGRTDVLVCNAGTSMYKLICDTSAVDFDRVTGDNLKSAFLTTRAFYDDFAFGRRGSIIYISSVWGQKGASNEAAYSAAKAGITGLVRSAAKELAPCGVRVNAIAPGAVKTDMLAHFTAEELENIGSEIPLGRIGAPSDIAGVALFLASDLASYITGETVTVSGGYDL